MAQHDRARIADKGWRVPRDLRTSGMSEQTAMSGRGGGIMRVGCHERVLGHGGVPGKRDPTWHKTLSRVFGFICKLLPKTEWPCIITGAQPGTIMAPAPDGHEELGLADELDCGKDVSHVATADNIARPPIDYTVINFASHLIARIVRLQQVPTQTGLESVNAGRAQHQELLHDPQVQTSYWRCVYPVHHVLHLLYAAKGEKTWRNSDEVVTKC